MAELGVMAFSGLCGDAMGEKMEGIDSESSMDFKAKGGAGRPPLIKRVSYGGGTD